ncbi:MAG: bifunctional homocysteine S-methyltransferase/methylenetetrahydrofolate reductase [Armatimonadota bacterium]|nr:bifunctional homocysteine S-methyltransferase/methylenetetrahydrofolate reductase [Armatimonadota bacterium]MDR7402562.1 bifunctional homocysteine S-methyltransferase/methylenetetrahydrofolate reductase [Armatimonadota bacterium]MDR7403839.1 bifunctional homocysteine S-methyltransferase/methylenetetrahydrofolate reductase [Armatimonadota bacterium]MDR7436054.1 bifunctional homocysteine S-methyltransferase/methylenetetrahydrofolate reductase [Armatimonadota bacterium]MDR7471933.1 bifunctional
MHRSAHPFLERLQEGVLLADGAMGTQLYARGVPFDQCFDALNLTRPDLVRQIHLDYIHSGAELIETNTFGANRFKLAQHALAHRLGEINRAGAALARETADAAGRPVFVAGSMGPIGRPMAPLGAVSPEEVRQAYAEQAAALVEGGCDVLILETFTDLAELVEAVRGVRDATDVPLIAQMTFTQEGRTLLGHEPAEIVRTLEALPVDVVGANCSVGSLGILQVIQRMAAASPAVFLSAMPNAGFPAYVGGRYIYVSTPSYMAGHARQMAALGARIVGGCCGTTPEHIAAMREALAGPAPAVTTAVVEFPPARPPAEEPAARPEPTPLAQKLGRTFVITVEVDPPRGAQDRRELDGCRRLQEAGVDAVDVADNPLARLRMSPWAMCARIQSEVGLETVLHFTTRDRNLVRLQSDLLAVHALGVRNVLVLRGDPPQMGDYPNATAVSDVTPSGLVRLIKEFNRGRDQSGNPIGAPTAFTVGVALNLAAADLDREVRVLERKVRAGADFICTMPIYDPEVLDRFLRVAGGLPLPTLVGVLPLVSHRHAEFLHNEVPGFRVPDWVRERMRLATDARAEGIRIAHALVEAIRGRVAGLYLIPSFGRFDAVLELVRLARRAAVP